MFDPSLLRDKLISEFRRDPSARGSRFASRSASTSSRDSFLVQVGRRQPDQSGASSPSRQYFCPNALHTTLSSSYADKTLIELPSTSANSYVLYFVDECNQHGVPEEVVAQHALFMIDSMRDGLYMFQELHRKREEERHEPQWVQPSSSNNEVRGVADATQTEPQGEHQSATDEGKRNGPIPSERRDNVNAPLSSAPRASLSPLSSNATESTTKAPTNALRISNAAAQVAGTHREKIVKGKKKFTSAAEQSVSAARLHGSLVHQVLLSQDHVSSGSLGNLATRRNGDGVSVRRPAAAVPAVADKAVAPIPVISHQKLSRGTLTKTYNADTPQSNSQLIRSPRFTTPRHRHKQSGAVESKHAAVPHRHVAKQSGSRSDLTLSTPPPLSQRAVMDHSSSQVSTTRTSVGVETGGDENLLYVSPMTPMRRSIGALDLPRHAESPQLKCYLKESREAIMLVKKMMDARKVGVSTSRTAASDRGASSYLTSPLAPPARRLTAPTYSSAVSPSGDDGTSPHDDTLGCVSDVSSERCTNSDENERRSVSTDYSSVDRDVWCRRRLKHAYY